jgi:hypothetical protein
MDDPLATYLNDHIAGSAHAVDLLEALCNQHANEPLGEFAGRLLAEVQADRAVLKGIADRIGDGSSKLKEMTGWMAEKVTRFKLHRDRQSGFGTFEALELLALGIYGKLLLWRALALIAPMDARLQGVDFVQLATRAEAQHTSTEERRLQLAASALHTARAA